MWLVASITSWAMFSLGMILMIAILLRRSFRYQRRANSQTPRTVAMRREPSREKPLLDAPPEILRWQVEMHETARDLKGELDSKMGALQALVRIAQEESERLEAAIDRAERLGLSECRHTLAEIERLWRKTRLPALLGGRLGPDEAAPWLAALGELLHRLPAIAQIDVNPVIAGRRGAMAVDARVVAE